MATAAAAPAAPAEGAAPKKKKSLMIIIVAVLAVVLIGGGAAAFFMLRHSGGHNAAHAEAAKPPVFYPLETFTVNLADRDRERFLQTSIALEVKDEHVAERIKAFGPMVRDKILILLSSQTADQVSSAEGKQALAKNIVVAINSVIAGELGPDAKPDDFPVRSALFASLVVQ